jgi:DNA-directed RNA polymerase specialized sigma subunit
MKYSAQNLEMIEDNNDPFTLLMQKEEGDVENHYMEAGIKFLNIMSQAVSFILESKNKTIATLAVAYALELDVVGGKSQRETAAELGISHGTISWQVSQFKEYSGIDLNKRYK